jgi:hypothetical protein
VSDSEKSAVDMWSGDIADMAPGTEEDCVVCFGFVVVAGTDRAHWVVE